MRIKIDGFDKPSDSFDFSIRIALKQPEVSQLRLYEFNISQFLFSVLTLNTTASSNRSNEANPFLVQKG